MEIRDLQRTEVAEVAEPWRLEQFSSSTLPQKQNPEVSEWWQGLARLARGASSALSEVYQQHERDISRLAPELQAIPNLFLYASAAIAEATRIVSGLQVHADRMLANLMIGGGLTMAESVMLGLAEKAGARSGLIKWCTTSRSRWRPGKAISSRYSRRIPKSRSSSAVQKSLNSCARNTTSARQSHRSTRYATRRGVDAAC